MLRSVTVTITLTEAPLIFLKGTVMGRMGCIPILPINVLFVTVMVTESLCVNRPLYQYLEGDSDIFEEIRQSSDLDLRWQSMRNTFTIRVCGWVNNFSQVCLSVSLSVQIITLELLEPGISF